eukprot:s295_g10.t1
MSGERERLETVLEDVQKLNNAFPEYDGSELVIAPHLHKVDPDGEGVADEDGDDSVGQAISTVPSLPKIAARNCTARHSHVYLRPDEGARLIGLSDDEARAIRHRLRLRLGALSSAKLVSGKNLHDAVHALGLTRYSIDDINEMVNLVADFINLGFEARDRRSRRQTVFSWETAAPSPQVPARRKELGASYVKAVKVPDGMAITHGSAMVRREIILRLHFLSCRGFWCGEDRLWNWFDVALCSTSIADVSVQFASASPTDIGGRELSLLRFCRLIRLVRIVKVFRLKFMKDLRLMVKGLVAGIRTLVLAFTLLVSVIYVIAGFATMSFGGITGVQVPGVDMDKYFYNLPMSMFTAFRCFTGDCVTDQGFPLTFLLSDEFGLTFAACYIVSYMLVSMGSVAASRHGQSTCTDFEHAEACDARSELLKKFAAAFRLFQDPILSPSEDDVHDGIALRSAARAITKELFLLVIQDRGVQQLMDELDLPPDRANLFEVIDADGSGTLHIAELVQGLLKIRGEINKSDTVAALLAAKAVQNILVDASTQV